MIYPTSMRVYQKSKLPENPNPWQLRIEELREIHRISLTKIQQATGWSRYSFYEYCSKKNTPPPANIYTKEMNQLLAQALHTSPHELWSLWQKSVRNSKHAKHGLTDIMNFIINYPEPTIPKELLIKLLEQ